MCGIFALLNKSNYLTPKFIDDAFMNGKNRGPEKSKYTFINPYTEFGLFTPWMEDTKKMNMV